MDNNTTTPMYMMIVSGWIRALLAAVSGWLISKGIFDASTGQQFVTILMPALTGLVVLGGTMVWSTVEKKMHALLPPPVATVANNPPTG